MIDHCKSPCDRTLTHGSSRRRHAAFPGGSSRSDLAKRSQTQWPDTDVPCSTTSLDATAWERANSASVPSRATMSRACPLSDFERRSTWLRGAAREIPSETFMPHRQLRPREGAHRFHRNSPLVSNTRTRSSGVPRTMIDTWPTEQDRRGAGDSEDTVQSASSSQARTSPEPASYAGLARWLPTDCRSCASHRRRAGMPGQPPLAARCRRQDRSREDTQIRAAPGKSHDRSTHARWPPVTIAGGCQ